MNRSSGSKGRLKASVANAFAAVGGFALTRLATARQPKVLMYHRFSESPRARFCCRASFRNQVEYFARHHTVLTMAQFAAAVSANAVPKNALVLTVDDGYRDFCQVAAEELLRVGVPATFYVTTGFIDGTCWIWTEKLAWICEQLPDGDITVNLGGSRQTFRIPDERGAVLFALKTELCDIPLADKIRHLHEFAVRHHVEVPTTPPAEIRPATWDDLRRLQAQGIEIGGHTVNHPILSAETDAVVAAEVIGCKERLDRELPEPVTSFCYPNGTPLDFDDRVKRCVQAAGFSSAVASQHVRWTFDDRYDIPRYSAGDDVDHARRVASGFEYLERRLRKSLSLNQDDAWQRG